MFYQRRTSGHTTHQKSVQWLRMETHQEQQTHSRHKRRGRNCGQTVRANLTQHNRRGDRFEEVNPARFQADDTALLIPKLTDTSTLSLNQTYLNAWISDLQQPPPQKPPPTVRRRPRPRPRPNPTTPQSQKPKSDSPNGPTKRKRKLSPYMNVYWAIYNTVSTKIAGELTPTDNVAVCSAKKCGQVLCLFFSLFVVVAVEGKAYQDGLGRLRKDGCSCFAV